MNATITTLPGDGIGPEVVAEAIAVINRIAQIYGHTFEIRTALLGGCAIDAHGTALPQETVDACTSAHAVLLGAVGGPKWDNPSAKVRPEQGLLGIRKALGLFANLRPVTIHENLLAASPLRPELLKDVDMVVVRELTGGIYFGEKKRSPHASGEVVIDTCIYTTGEVERIIRAAATIARGRKKKLVSVDKANVLETSRLWRATTTRVMAEEFPDVALEHMLVDACAMHLIRRPADFDVIVTENMFGDILTDEASQLAGSMGMLPSASLGADSGGSTRMGLYEPIHGSAPDIAGKGIANPMATVLSVALMLRHSFGLEIEAQAVENAVYATLEAGIVTGDVAAKGASVSDTKSVGAAIVARIA
ncbi:MAG: 3-isopropylmalate dehydrogenase [Roseiflexaceae bacterium]